MKFLNSDEFPSLLSPSSARPLNQRSTDGRITEEPWDSIYTPGMRNSGSGRIDKAASTRVTPSAYQYVGSNEEEISANDITEDEIVHGDTRTDRVRSNFIYTPGVGSPSIKTSSSGNGTSAGSDIDSEPEGESASVSRQIIEEFILRHSTPDASSETHMDTDPVSAPISSASSRTNAGVSSQAPRTRLTIPERNRILASDSRTDLVKLDKVKCGKCKEWIKVSQTSIFCWEKHVNTCFNVNSLTPLQISRRIELAGDIRVTSFGPRHVECAFCDAHVKLKGADDYTLKSWKLHIAHCRGWDKEHITAPQLTGTRRSDVPPRRPSIARAEHHKRARNRGLSFLSRTGGVRWPLSTRSGLRSSTLGRRLRTTTINQRSTNPSSPTARHYQRTAGSDSRKIPRTEGRRQSPSTQPSLGPTSASLHREVNQLASAPGAMTVRPVDTRPSANTRARAVAYTRPETLKQHGIGRGDRASP